MQVGKKSRYLNPSSERIRAHLLPMGEGELWHSFFGDSFSSSVLPKRGREKVPDRGDEGFWANILGGVFH